MDGWTDGMFIVCFVYFGIEDKHFKFKKTTTFNHFKCRIKLGWFCSGFYFIACLAGGF